MNILGCPSRFVHLKTKNHKTFDEQRFAVLWQPESQTLSCDRELYELVRKHGSVTIWPFKPHGFELENDLVTLTPEEFEQEWRGD
jgi:hypothetical protein